MRYVNVTQATVFFNPRTAGRADCRGAQTDNLVIREPAD
jgi:hypothetical protein